MTVGSIFAILRRRFIPLLLCLLAGIAAGCARALAAKVYASPSRVFLTSRPRRHPEQGVQLSGRGPDSYASMVESRSAAEEVRQQLGWFDSVGLLTG
jgi:uncharacterized protein involved in exopolysaccharide biosynthesis